MRRFLSLALTWLARLFGQTIRDARDGRILGRAFLFAWGGKLHVVGAHCERWIPIPLPQTNRLVYWKQYIGFTTHNDAFPERKEPALSILKHSPYSRLERQVLLAVLDHRAPDVTTKSIVLRLNHGFQPDQVLLLYGGSHQNFQTIQWSQKIFLDDLRLRTVNHIRESQSYRSVLQAVSSHINLTHFTHVLFVEADHIFLAPNIPSCFLAEMDQQDADILGYQVRRLDGTIHPHNLGTISIPTYPQPQVWSMLGAGHFWKREAWEAVTAKEVHSNWYLELDLATTAVELGFRVISITHQEPFVVDIPSRLSHTIESARKSGAWTLHPVKNPF